MNKIIRNVGFGIGVALALVCGFVSIYALYCGDEAPVSWGVFFVFAVGLGVGGVLFFVCCSPRIATYIADALRLGGKQMLCDIIKWTIIIIIAAIVLAVAYKIAVSSGESTSYGGGYIL